MPQRLPPCLRSAAMALAAAFTLLQASGTDDRIVQAAKGSYNFRTYLKDDDIRIAAKSGAVTLTGQVADALHRSVAEDTVAGLPGVASVNTQLSLKESPGGLQPDALLRAKVRTALLFHRELSSASTEVTVDRGVVTLRGTAATRAQRDRAGEYVKGLDGVAGVVNEMTVSGDPQPRRRAIRKRIDDASITAQVKLALLFNRSTSALRTRVRTENGVVFLSGEAANRAERDRVKRVVQNIEGIRSMRNQITVP